MNKAESFRVLTIMLACGRLVHGQALHQYLKTFYAIL